MDTRQRFDIGLSLFIIGIAWNVYFSVRQIAEDSATAFGPYLVAGGSVATIGLVIIVMLWQKSGRPPWR